MANQKEQKRMGLMKKKTNQEKWMMSSFKS
jgi:hypothetical protein